MALHGEFVDVGRRAALALAERYTEQAEVEMYIRRLTAKWPVPAGGRTGGGSMGCEPRLVRPMWYVIIDLGLGLLWGVHMLTTGHASELRQRCAITASDCISCDTEQTSRTLRRQCCRTYTRRSLRHRVR